MSSSSLLSEEKERQFDEIASYYIFRGDSVGVLLINKITACPSTIVLWVYGYKFRGPLITCSREHLNWCIL